MSAHTPMDLESCSSSEVIEAPPRGGAVRKPDTCSSTAASEAPPAPRVAWEEEEQVNTTEDWWKALLKKFIPFNRSTKTEETEACAFEPEPRNTANIFHSLYDVGKKIDSSPKCWIHKGYRNSDYKRVLIHFVRKRPTDRLVELPGYPSVSQVTYQMLRLQKKQNKNIVELYDLFLFKDVDILVYEQPWHYVSLVNLYENGSRFTDNSVRYIIQQLIRVLKYCMDCGVYPEICMDNVLIHTYTLHVKLVNFRGTLFSEERREDEPVLTAEELVQTVTEHFCQLLEWLVRFSKHERNLSEEARDLLKKLRDKQSPITLDAILDHALINGSRQKSRFSRLIDHLLHRGL